MSKPLQYSLDDVRSAVKDSKTITDVRKALGVSNGNGARKLDRIIEENQIDISHLNQNKIKDQQIIDAVARHSCISDVRKSLGISTGSGYLALKRRIATLKLSTDHFIHPRWKRCLVVKETAWRTKGDSLTRALIDHGTVYECAWCGNPGVWRDQPLKLQVDHVDGNSRDNRLENLRFLCANCHTQTETHSVHKSKVA